MIEEERHPVGWQSLATLRILAANRSGRKENVKALYVTYGVNTEN